MTREDYCPVDPSFGHKWRVPPGDYDGTQDLECRDCGAKKPGVNSSDQVTDPTIDQAVQSFKSWCQGGDGMDELEFKEYITERYTAEKVLEARIDELEHLSEDEDGNIPIRCEFTIDNPTCKDDKPLDERLEILQAELSKLKEEG